jgi:hypothetical protein
MYFDNSADPDAHTNPDALATEGHAAIDRTIAEEHALHDVGCPYPDEEDCTCTPERSEPGSTTTGQRTVWELLHPEANNPPTVGDRILVAYDIVKVDTFENAHDDGWLHYLVTARPMPPWRGLSIDLTVPVEAMDHGPVASTWFGINTWPTCSCGYDPHDNIELGRHWHALGFTVVDDHGTLVKKPLP